jgi:hypothetical protein
MLKTLIRVFIAALVLIVVFFAGIFASSQGIFSWLTGNARTTTNVVTILDRIQMLSRLTTTRYSYDNILTSEREMPDILRGLYGERLVMVAVGEVIAGIDLSQITEEDINVIEGNTLVVRIPPAELQDCFFNEQASYVVSRDTGLFARPLPNLDETSRLYALDSFRTRAIEDGILADAQAQAETAVQELLNATGQFTEVRIVSDPQGSEPILPPTCQ